MSEFKLNYTGQEIQNKLDKIDEINTLQSRIDALTSLPEGSTTGDAELVDIRVKADGTTAPTAGTAVREQISELKGDLVKLADIYHNNALISDNTLNFNVVDGNGICNIGKASFENGKNYFLYANFNVTNLTAWNDGIIYLRILGNNINPNWANKYVNNIENEHEYTIFYNFIANSDESMANIQLFLKYGNPSTNNFNVTVNKLFLIESSEDLANICNETHDSKDIVILKIPDESVSFDILSKEVSNQIPHSNKNIIDCWGDSLTYGVGGNNYTYPSKLQELIGDSFVVNNYGHGGETANAIAFRQGAIGALLNPFTAQKETWSLNNFKSIDGTTLSSLKSNAEHRAGVNNIIIDGKYYMFRTTSNADEGNFYNYGNTLTFERPTIIHAEGCGINHIMIVCMGQNGTYGDVYDNHKLISLYKKMIEHNNSDKYLIVGIPTRDSERWSELEILLGYEFGDRFVNAREYISYYGLSDNNISPTSDDTQAMSVGAIPPSLLISDGIHLNDYGYIAMAKCIYLRGKQLCYWN